MKNLETTLEKVARMLTRQYGINVVFGSTVPCTDGKTIYLPTLPRDVSSDLVADMKGYLDHESAHCIFTDFPFVGKCVNEFHKNLLNAVEDSRIERCMIRKYPGAALSLDPLNEKWRGINNSKWAEAPLLWRIISTIRDHMDGLESPKDAEVAPYVAKVADLLNGLNEAEDTEDLFKITKEITKRLESAKAQESAQESSQELPGSESDSEDEGSEGDSGSEDEGSEGEGSGGDSGSEDEGSGSEDEGSEGEGSEGDSGSEDEGSEGSEGEGGPVTSGKLVEEDFDAEMSVTDIHTLVQGEIKDLMERMRTEYDGSEFKIANRTGDFSKVSGKHLPFTTQYDKTLDETKVSAVRRTFYQKLTQKVRALTNKIKLDLEEALKVQENSYWMQERDRGRLNQKSLAKLVSQPGYRRPFKKQYREETKDVAVQIVVDLSGSMGGDGKIQAAREVCTTLAEALQQIGIDYEIVGFTANGSKHRLPHDYQPGIYNRSVSAIELSVFKEFSGYDNAGIANMSSRGDNVDGESIRMAAKRLEQVQHSRKIMFVLSDGMPQCVESNHHLLAKDLVEAVSEIENAGIEVIGFGILTDSVKRFYKKNVVVYNVMNLPKVVMESLKKEILQGRKA